jgi:hypothetical protein
MVLISDMNICFSRFPQVMVYIQSLDGLAVMSKELELLRMLILKVSGAIESID